ncbi:MAG: DUF4157 domain-containing protein [Acidobacteria bacterium]|nr:DUF4157 domain-containing protein [Acidobacteriota bacterium]MBV9477110.1 DUF4157 domain-containing protein [Acidobacteriota bacterium]
MQAGTVLQGFFPHGLRQQHNATIQRLQNGTATKLGGNFVHHCGAGMFLPGTVRQAMESFFGAGFSDVRVHACPQAAAMGAIAFTQGSQIHVTSHGSHAFASRGPQILVHELAHVVQQRTGRVRNPFGSGTAIVQDQMLEAEAERMAQRWSMHAPAIRPHVARGSAEPVQPLCGWLWKAITSCFSSAPRGPAHGAGPGGAAAAEAPAAVYVELAGAEPPERALPRVLRNFLMAIGMSASDINSYADPFSLSAQPLSELAVSNLRCCGTLAATAVARRAALVADLTAIGLRVTGNTVAVGALPEPLQHPVAEEINAFLTYSQRPAFDAAKTVTNFLRLVRLLERA